MLKIHKKTNGNSCSNKQKLEIKEIKLIRQKMRLNLRNSKINLHFNQSLAKELLQEMPLQNHKKKKSSKKKKVDKADL